MNQDSCRKIINTLVGMLRQSLGESLTSVALFGSRTRGTARADSDIDLLLVVRHAPPVYHERLKPVFEAVRQLRKVLSDQGETSLPEVNFLVLSEEEAREGRGIYLDMAEEAVLLADDRGFLQTRLDEVRDRMKALGCRRVAVGADWYWELKPNLKPGETVSL